MSFLCIDCKRELVLNREPGFVVCPGCGLSQYVGEGETTESGVSEEDHGTSSGHSHP